MPMPRNEIFFFFEKTILMSAEFFNDFKGDLKLQIRVSSVDHRFMYYQSKF